MTSSRFAFNFQPKPIVCKIERYLPLRLSLLHWRWSISSHTPLILHYVPFYFNIFSDSLLLLFSSFDTQTAVLVVARMTQRQMIVSRLE
ncbi:unnamed protein product [Caenorhabditis nigoni]